MLGWAFSSARCFLDPFRDGLMLHSMFAELPDISVVLCWLQGGKFSMSRLSALETEAASLNLGPSFRLPLPVPGG